MPKRRKKVRSPVTRGQPSLKSPLRGRPKKVARQRAVIATRLGDEHDVDITVERIDYYYPQGHPKYSNKKTTFARNKKLIAKAVLSKIGYDKVTGEQVRIEFTSERYVYPYMKRKEPIPLKRVQKSIERSLIRRKRTDAHVQMVNGVLTITYHYKAKREQRKIDKKRAQAKRAQEKQRQAQTRTRSDKMKVIRLNYDPTIKRRSRRI